MDGERTNRRRYEYAAEIARLAGAGPRVEAAFAAVPRDACLTPPPWHLVAPGGWLDSVTSDPDRLYEDVLVVLDPDRGINNGQPSLHAAWMEALSLGPGETVVVVGAGSGYYAAILAELVGEDGRVEAFEIEPRLAALARRNLGRWPQVRVHARSAASAIPAADVVYVAAAVAAPPAAWLRSLKPGGRIIFPWDPYGHGGSTILARAGPSGLAVTPLADVSFISCVGAPGLLAAPDAARREARSLHLVAEREPDVTAVAVAADVWFSSDPPVRGPRSP